MLVHLPFDRFTYCLCHIFEPMRDDIYIYIYIIVPINLIILFYCKGNINTFVITYEDNHVLLDVVIETLFSGQH